MRTSFQNYRFYLLISISIFWISGCSTKKAFLATAPESAYQKAVERVKEVSTLNVPIEIPLSEVERKINEQLGNLLFEDNSLDNNGGDNLMLTVNKRLPLTIEPKGGNQFNVKVPVNIWAKAGWKVEKFGLAVAKYEETRFDVDINFLTRISLDGNWKVNTTTTPNGFKWISEPKIKIGFFDVPITSIIEKIINRELPNVTQIVDAEVAKINLKPTVETAWKSIQTPFLINQDYDAWLKVTPIDVMMTPLGNKGRNVRVGIGIKASAETFMGLKPSEAVISTIPQLKLVDKMEDKFEVGMITQIPYSQARKLAMDQTGGKTYEFKEGKYKITVMDLEIYGQGEFLIVAATLAGSLNGKVFLKGKPYFDPATKSLKMNELDYDLDTKNKLVKTANWLAHGKFLKLMEPYFSISVATQLEEAKKLIEQNLAGNQFNKNINLNGQLEKLEPQAIYLTPAGIQAVILAVGKMEIKLSGL